MDYQRLGRPELNYPGLGAGHGFLGAAMAIDPEGTSA
jgi:hypothetical protein